MRTEVPELRIVPDVLWVAAKARQDELSVRYKKQIETSREATGCNEVANALNATHRPRTLLSGLLFCGCCGGAHARHGQDRYACSNHVLSTGCDNSRTIARHVLEARVLAGLRDRLMAPDAAAAAMRAYAEETNHLNHDRCASWEADKRALADAEKGDQGNRRRHRTGRISSRLT